MLEAGEGRDSLQRLEGRTVQRAGREDSQTGEDSYVGREGRREGRRVGRSSPEELMG